MKKKWKKPKLLVLARGRPEESVLGYCKIENRPWFGPYSDGCGWHIIWPEACKDETPT